MKKIININLSGRVIPIEDSAYENLQAYIESLRRYFSKEEGRDEIINDIESRIAELMSEKVRLGASVITGTDVEEIIASMGRPEDFDAETLEAADVKSAGEGEQSGSTEKKRRGRLYRDTSDKFLGGVCSGIANYLNIDPAIVRILFAIITFGGFGLGILIYILLWLILPPKDLDYYKGKRLFRNPDDRIIGGVASGLAAYFNKRSSTIRLIFAIPLIANILFGILNGIFFDFDQDFFVIPNIFFGSFTGTFILGYIILWMVLPEARSPYEKMEMRGEKVDVNTIRQNVKEGMDNMKDRVKEWGQEVKESAQNIGTRAKNFADTRGKAFVAEAGDAARRTGGGLGHAIGVLFKVFFLFIAGSIAFALFVALIAFLFGGIAWWPVNSFLWTSKWQQAFAWGTLIFFLIVPLIAIITWVVRRILRVRSRSNYLSWTFAGLWTLGWISAIFLAASISKDLREYEHSDTAITITQPLNNRMIVTVSEPPLEYSGNFGWINEGSEGWDLSDDTMKLSIVRFDIKKSEDDQYRVVLKKYSAGRNRREAIERADQIQYNVLYKDSVLDLGSGYAISKESKFRGQKIEVEIRIPAGKKINFHESIKNKLSPANIKVYRNGHWRKRGVDIDFDDDEQFPYRSGIDYIMHEDGELKDTAGNRVNNDYRYNNTDTSSGPASPADLQKQLDDEKRKREESDRKIRDLEQKQKDSQPRSTSFKRSKTITRKDAVASGSRSGIFSLTEIWN